MNCGPVVWHIFKTFQDRLEQEYSRISRNVLDMCQTTGPQFMSPSPHRLMFLQKKSFDWKLRPCLLTICNVTSGPALSCWGSFYRHTSKQFAFSKFPSEYHKQAKMTRYIHTMALTLSETRDGPRLDADGDADHHLHQGCRAADVGGDFDDNRHDHQRRNIVRLDDAIRACRRNLHSFQ